MFALNILVTMVNGSSVTGPEHGFNVHFFENQPGLIKKYSADIRLKIKSCLEVGIFPLSEIIIAVAGGNPINEFGGKIGKKSRNGYSIRFFSVPRHP